AVVSAATVELDGDAFGQHRIGGEGDDLRGARTGADLGRERNLVTARPLERSLHLHEYLPLRHARPSPLQEGPAARIRDAGTIPQKGDLRRALELSQCQQQVR